MSKQLLLFILVMSYQTQAQIVEAQETNDPVTVASWNVKQRSKNLRLSKIGDKSLKSGSGVIVIIISPEGKLKDFYIAKLKIVYATQEEVDFVKTQDEDKGKNAYPDDVKEVYPILKKYIETEIRIHRNKNHPKEDRDTNWALSLKLR